VRNYLEDIKNNVNKYMSQNNILQRSNDILTEQLEHAESDSKKVINDKIDMKKQLDEIKSEYIEFKRKISDSFILAKDNKLLNNQNSLLQEKLKSFEDKNNLLVQKCRGIESEYVCQIDELNNKIKSKHIECNS